MKKIYSFFLILSIGLSACKKDSRAAWLKIDSVKLTTNAVTEGENSHGITDIWVYMDNEPLGVFEVPCEIPIITDEGNHHFIFYAGVNQNGINSTKIRYPFYDKVEANIVLTKEQTVNYTPNFTYKQGISFVGMENFEDTGIILQNDPNEDTTTIKILSALNYPNIVKYGSNCGHIHVSSTDTIAQVFTDIALSLPKTNIYMELDYMNNNTFAQGMITSQEILDPYLRINAQDNATIKWKKMYINIGEQTNYLAYNSSAFNYYFVVNLDSDNAIGDIYLDNIKILYFE